MRMHLSEMVCVVTGARGGTAPAIIQLLSKNCKTVIAVGHGKKETLDRPIDRVVYTEGDVASQKSVQTLVQRIIVRFGGIHVWINTVGGFEMGKSVDQTSLVDWNRMMVKNFQTALICCREVIPIMKEQRFGRIINFASVAGIEGMGFASPYSVSKAAVIHLTKTIALETKKTGITANVITPSIIDTPRNRKTMPTADFSSWIKTSKIANIVVEIIGEDINGHVIRLD